jgi:hypothetical protein
MVIALDRSLRSYDLDKRLFVESCNLSKAMICPYLGKEIPRYQELGLDPDKVYRLYRDPAELEAAAPTFRNLPLLITHKAVSADEPAQQLVVGTTGDQVKFDPPYLKASIAAWTAQAIRAIESGHKEQLSCGYHYVADMTPGYAMGEYFDGRMTQLVGNHVALVEEGRCGPEVVVPDHLPPELKMRAKLAEALKPFLAKDADPEKLTVALDAAMKDCEAEDDEEEEEEEKKKKAADKKAKDKKAKDEKDDEEEEKKAKDKKAKDGDPDHRKDFESEKDKAKDAALAAAKDAGMVTADEMKAAIKAASDAAVARVEALHVARREVEPICGVDVALDSAEAVYGFALKQLKIDTKDVPPAAYKALLSVAKHKATPAPKLGMDCAAANAAIIWPGLAQIRA